MAFVNKLLSLVTNADGILYSLVVEYNDANLSVSSITITINGGKCDVIFKHSNDSRKDIIIAKLKGDEVEVLKFTGPGLKVSLEPFINRDGIPRDNFVLEGFELSVTWQSN